MTKLRIVLADDQVLLIQSLKRVLETLAKDIKVVGMATDGYEAIECVEKYSPDVVLMDVRMPRMDGVEAARIIHEKHPGVQVMMLTTYDDDEYVYNALHDGAVGYLLKDTPPEDLISSIRTMQKGVVPLSPTIASKLVNKAGPPQETSESQNEENTQLMMQIHSLSKREKEIFDLIAKGLDNKEISKTLFITEQTVKNHISSIYSKLDVHNRIQAMHLAIKAHWST